MNKLKELKNYFTKHEKVLWISSAILIILSFCIFDRENYLTLAASLIGVTSLIFNAKGNPIGQVLMVVFSLLYGIISFSLHALFVSRTKIFISQSMVYNSENL